MSLLFVLVGQCGNQVGKEICRGLPQTERTHHADGRVRCVGVDTEPKVIEKLLNEDAAAKTKVFHPSAFVWDESGRGNNWAFGYTGAELATSSISREGEDGGRGVSPPPGQAHHHHLQQQQQPRFCTRFRPTKKSIADRAMALIKEEVQRAGFVEGIVFVHSLAGGTGSGLGSRLLEECRAAFDEEVMYYASVVVAPHRFGDTAVSSLNALLTLNHLLMLSDIVLYFNNSDVSDALAGAQQGGGGGAGGGRPGKHPPAVSLAQINTHIARSVLVLLKFGSQPFIVSEWIAALAPHPMHKLAVVQMYAPSNPASPEMDVWASAVRRSLLNQRNTHVVGCLWCAVACSDADAKGASTALAQHTARHTHVPITPSVIHLPGPTPQRQIVTATSCPLSAMRILIPIANLAGAKAYAGAYIHWYEKYGVLIRDFMDALQRFRQVVETYQAYLKSRAPRGGRQAAERPRATEAPRPGYR